MRRDYSFIPISGLDARLLALKEEAACEGFRFVARLTDEWSSGSNTFSKTGEHLIGAFWQDQVLGFCGLNRDPYTTESGVGRLRHLYVKKAERQQGIGSALVRHLLEQARSSFELVRLRTATLEAALFYERIGFAKVRDDHASHAMRL